MTRGPLELPVRRSDFGDHVGLAVDLGPDSIVEWLLHLCLLKCGLEVTFTIVAAGGAPLTLRIALRRDPDPSGPGRVEWASDSVSVFIDEEELDAWLLFFLRHYRGWTPVDHLDVDIDRERSNTSMGLYLTLRVLPPTVEERRNVELTEDAWRRIQGLVSAIQRPDVQKAVEELRYILQELDRPDLEGLWAAADDVHECLEGLRRAREDAEKVLAPPPEAAPGSP